MKLKIILSLLFFPLTAMAVDVTLRWQDNSNNENGFRIYRAIGTNEFIGWAVVEANVVEWIDVQAEYNNTYRYRVTGFNVFGESAPTNIAIANIGPAGVLPEAPTNLVAVREGNIANQSARGMITGTDTTLIPGFAVTEGPVLVLIRVIGPTLAQFGLAGVCADPSLSIVRQSDGAVVADNDNWSGQDVIDASVRARAFPLQAGSKDAAIVLVLAPGSYTVVARGVAGATGIGLAEIYKVP